MRSSFLITLISVSVLILNGCANFPLEEQNQGENNSVEKISSRKGEIGSVKIVKHGNKTWISGSVRRKTASRILKGHVHVELRIKKNTILDRSKVEYQFSKRGRRLSSSAKFKTELDTSLTEDIIIKIEHHDKNHAPENNGTLNIM